MNTASSTNGEVHEASKEAGLHFASDEMPGIRRKKAGGRFSYHLPKGALVRDAATLARIRRLAIPPAWTDVWICADPLGHLQATGRDAKQRKQYRYHSEFRASRDAAKYEHLLSFAAALPRIRAAVETDMALPGLPRRKVLSTIVRLLETTMIRVGNDDYARANGSYGLTTLRDPHVKVDGPRLLFDFKGKGGKPWRLKLTDRRVARVVKACQELPGQHLFQYLGDDGARQRVTSADVNAYLLESCGRAVTAKDFRTWGGTVLAAILLREYHAPANVTQAKRDVRDAIKRVSQTLGNTPTICRQCYVHPEIVEAYVTGGFTLTVRRARERPETLRAEERAVMAFLKRHLSPRAPRKPRAAVEATIAAKVLSTGAVRAAA
ncbi:MAG: DNA topoisomerase IB [Alphaproteobacteria bacterium]|nr:DNA topoisomerase IB [Alphaproteobacteria bacterium]